MSFLTSALSKLAGGAADMSVGSSNGVGSGGTLVKAVIREVEGSNSVTCAFNPATYSITKNAKWKQEEKPAVATAPPAEFLGTGARTLVLKGLLFDAWATGTDISGDVTQLLDWMNPTEDSFDREQPRPPLLSFTWGRNQFFQAYLSTATANYQLFDTDGTPLRATVDVTLVEVASPAGRQNPTSGGVVGNRAALVTEDTSLPAIAYREYGRSNLWRGLAALNGIDDPFRVPVGTRLIVPPRRDVEALS